MKKTLISLLVLALTMTAEAQTKDSIDTAQFAVVYDYSLNTLDDEGIEVCDSIQVVVQVGQKVTKSLPMTSYLIETQKVKIQGMDMADYRKRLSVEHIETLTHMPTVWTNYPEGETTVREVIFPRKFEGYEPTQKLAWKLSTDTLHISGYLCSRAETTFRGIRWEVWYTEEIPSSAGPWRLHGLPGLIVKATSEAHSFTLTELYHENTAITYETDIKIERMKYPKLLKYHQEVLGSKLYAKNPLHHLPNNNSMTLNQDFFMTAGIKNVYVINNENGDGGYIIADNLHMLQKAHVYQPLEKK